MRSEPRVRRWRGRGWGLPAQRGRTPSTVSAVDCSPLRDQRLHRGATASVQSALSRRRNRSASGSVVRSSPRCSTLPPSCVSSQSMGRRDDQHGRRTAHPGSSRARDAAGGTRAAEGDPGHHPRLAPATCSRSSASDQSSRQRCLCAWSHPGRVHSEAAFAMLAGVAPIPANSGQVTTRYRLTPLRRPPPQHRTAHRGPDPDPVPTRATRGATARPSTPPRRKTSREIKRCLARYGRPRPSTA